MGLLPESDKYSAEEIMLNRKRAVYALRTSDESSMRIAEALFAGGGKVCAIGRVGTELGYTEAEYDLYTAVAESLGINEDGPDDTVTVSMIYQMNDDGLRDKEGNYISFTHSWKQIGDKIASLWGMD